MVAVSECGRSWHGDAMLLYPCFEREESGGLAWTVIELVGDRVQVTRVDRNLDAVGECMRGSDRSCFCCSAVPRGKQLHEVNVQLRREGEPRVLAHLGALVSRNRAPQMQWQVPDPDRRSRRRPRSSLSRRERPG